MSNSCSNLYKLNCIEIKNTRTVELHEEHKVFLPYIFFSFASNLFSLFSSISLCHSPLPFSYIQLCSLLSLIIIYICLSSAFLCSSLVFSPISAFSVPSMLSLLPSFSCLSPSPLSFSYNLLSFVSFYHLSSISFVLHLSILIYLACSSQFRNIL